MVKTGSVKGTAEAAALRRTEDRAEEAVYRLVRGEAWGEAYGRAELGLQRSGGTLGRVLWRWGSEFEDF